MIKDNFQSISQDKTNFVITLSHDDKLAKCLLNSQSDFLNYPVDPEDADNLCYSKIFPYYKVIGTSDGTDTQINASSYITMKFNYVRSKGVNYFKTSNIIFYLFCHESLVKTSYGILRYDYMLQRISELLNDSKSETWFGKMTLDEASDFTIDNKYLGVAAKFSSVSDV